MKNVQKDVRILELLESNDKTFYIPVYQRNYSWQREQIDILFDDVVKQMEENRDGHFFGSLYYFVEDAGVFENQRLVLIDGQQRLTTIMLFLIALRDLSDDEQFKMNIDKKYLLNANIKEQNKIKLKQAALDNIVYEKLIKGESTQAATHKIYDNYRRIKNHITNYISEKYSDNNQAGYVKILHGLNKLYLVLLELDNDRPAENPQIIFENINSIGLELTVNDLIRNYLLMGLGKEKQEKLYTDYWVSIENNIGDLDKNTPVFVRQFLQMKQFSKIHQDNKVIYRAYKKYFDSQNTTNENALFELEKFSKYYSMIIGISDHNNPDVSDLLFEIDTILTRTVTYCFILKLLSLNDESKLDDAKLIQLLNIVVSYSVRRTIMNLGSGGSMDELFINLSKLISDAENYERIVDDTYDYLSKRGYAQRFPTDNELKEQLKRRDYYSLKLNSYILEKISNQITDGNAPINFRNHADIQYEHIMPQSLQRDDGSGYISGDEYDEFFDSRINSFSNATLTDINQELGNLSFDKKKIKLVNDSNLLISRKWITDKENWDIAAMDERFEDIFPNLTNAFPYPKKYQTNIVVPVTTAEYPLDDLFQDDIEISNLRIIGLEFSGESFTYNNNLTKLYVDFLNTLSKIEGVEMDQLCDSPSFQRNPRSGETKFNFSKNRENVAYSEQSSTKTLENGIIVDASYSRRDLLQKMRDIIDFFDSDKKVVIRVLQ